MFFEFFFKICFFGKNLAWSKSYDLGYLKQVTPKVAAL
jgi:hypothetical protein